MGEKYNEHYPFESETQAALIRQLVADPVFLPRISAHFKPSKLSDPEASVLASEILGYFKTYDKVPTLTEIYQGLRLRIESGKFTKDEFIKAQEYYEESHSRPAIDTKYAQDLIFKEERASAMWTALDKSLERYKARTTEAFDQIVQNVTAANQIGRADVSLGSDYFQGLEARTRARREGIVIPRFGTGIIPLDELLSGGLAAGELGCFLAPAKGGKSLSLSHVALHIANQGGTALYLTHEMSESQIIDRLDAAISRVEINSLSRHHEKVHKRTKAFFDKTGGGIIVKYMSPGSSCRDIKTYLQNLRSERGISPTCLIVDYADKLVSSGRHEKRYEEMGMVYQELRSLAVDFNIPCWTASQTNREGLDQKIITADKIAASWAKVAEVDVLVAVCRTEEERLARQLRLYIAACRYATDGVEVGPFQSDFECGLLVVDGGLQPEG